MYPGLAGGKVELSAPLVMQAGVQAIADARRAIAWLP
jgi:hypothetical protein